MARHPSPDLHALLEVVHQMYEARSSAALALHVGRAVHRLVPGEISTYTDLDPHGGELLEWTWPAEAISPAGQQVFRQLASGHPLIACYARTGDGRARTISDLLTRQQLRMSPLYNEYVRPYCGTEHQMSIAVAATPTRVIGVTIARSGRDFSDRERQMFDLLRPHVVQAKRTVELIERQASEVVMFESALEAASWGVIAAGSDGRIRHMTTPAATWLAQYFPDPGPCVRLPDVVRGWLAAQEHAANGLARVRAPFVVARHGRRLCIRVVPDKAGRLLLLTEEPGTDLPAATREHGLTPREIDVLTWVAAGKTSAETAAILGTRTRTIEKHLEHIYRKLGVENRTAAAGVLRGQS